MSTLNRIATLLGPALVLILSSCPGPTSPDTTPPSLLSVAPANGSSNVAVDANVVLTFSEAMNQSSAQSAFQSTLGEVSFAWSPDSTVLSIDPKAALALAKDYSFSISNAAKDTAGNSLSNPGGFSFKTASNIPQPLTQVKRESATLNLGGETIIVDRYLWPDSKGLVRSVSLKRQGSGNTGNGGYAVQLSYPGPGNQIITINAASGQDGGFGYFVSHEQYRIFSDGSQGTIAAKHGEDDSPLGNQFAISEGPISLAVGASAASASHTFKQTYYRWGTTAPLPIQFDNNGNQLDRTPLGQHQKYLVPLEITWSFSAGKDYPRIRFKYDLEAAKVPVDALRFDVRGPYGVLDFDADSGAFATAVHWGDGFYKFSAVQNAGLTWQSPFTWNTAWNASRFQVLVFGGKYEMGLFEPLPLSQSIFTDGWADSRGKTGNAMPPDWQWPYQSLNYSLQNNTPTTGKKIAWGSSSFFGTSAESVYAGAGLAQTFAYGKKAQGAQYAPAVEYSLCLVVAQSSNATTLTEQAASQGGAGC